MNIIPIDVLDFIEKDEGELIQPMELDHIRPQECLEGYTIIHSTFDMEALKGNYPKAVQRSNLEKVAQSGSRLFRIFETPHSIDMTMGVDQVSLLSHLLTLDVRSNTQLFLKYMLK
jgi:hypothetical protein